MEVTTVSPSPASPTEGNDLCETDVTDVAIHSVTLLICLCGLVGNGALLGLLRLEIRNGRVFALAFADFLLLLFTAPSALLLLVEDLSCSSIMPVPYLSFLFHLSVLSCYWALFRLMVTRNTVDMFKICSGSRASERLWWLVFNFHHWAFFALFTLIPAVTNLCQTHEQGQCQAALSSLYAVILLLFAVPTVTFYANNIITAQWGFEKQQPKRLDIIFFFMVLFILLLSLCNFLQQLGYIAVPSQVFLLLNCICSSIKPFIYFLAGRCWSPCSLSSLRLSLQRVFDEQKEKTARSIDSPKDTVV